jgi:hypothetical protein
MHSFVYIEVLLLTGNDVIAKLPPAEVQVNLASSDEKMNYEFLLVFFCILGDIDQREVNSLKNSCLEGTPLAQTESFELLCVRIG